MTKRKFDMATLLAFILIFSAFVFAGATYKLAQREKHKRVNYIVWYVVNEDGGPVKVNDHKHVVKDFAEPLSVQEIDEFRDYLIDNFHGQLQVNGMTKLNAIE